MLENQVKSLPSFGIACSYEREWESAEVSSRRLQCETSHDPQVGFGTPHAKSCFWLCRGRNEARAGTAEICATQPICRFASLELRASEAIAAGRVWTAC